MFLTQFVEQTPDAVTYLSYGFTLLSDSITLLSDGVILLSDSITLLSDGVTLLSDGVTLLSDGITLLSYGITLLSDGVTLLSDGNLPVPKIIFKLPFILRLPFCNSTETLVELIFLLFIKPVFARIQRYPSRVKRIKFGCVHQTRTLLP